MNTLMKYIIDMNMYQPTYSYLFYLERKSIGVNLSEVLSSQKLCDTFTVYVQLTLGEQLYICFIVHSIIVGHLANTQLDHF